MNTPSGYLAGAALVTALTGCGGGGGNTPNNPNTEPTITDTPYTLVIKKYTANDTEASVKQKTFYALIAKGAEDSIQKDGVPLTATCVATMRKTGQALEHIVGQSCQFVIPKNTEDTIDVAVTADGYVHSDSPESISVDIKKPTLTVPTHDYASVGGQPFTYVIKSSEPLNVDKCTVTFQDGEKTPVIIDTTGNITPAGNNTYNVTIPSAPGVLQHDGHPVDYTTSCPDESGNTGKRKFSVESF